MAIIQDPMGITFHVTDQSGKEQEVKIEKTATDRAIISIGTISAEISNLRKNQEGTVIKGNYIFPITIEIKCNSEGSSIKIPLGTYKISNEDYRCLREWIQTDEMPPMN